MTKTDERELPLVSIVVPVYNAKEYLKECFDSVAGQTYKNIEIILVNDGSTDGSGILADSLAFIDKRVRVVHKENGGLSDARNAGIRQSSGEYLTFVDNDDIIHPQLVETLVDLIESKDADIAQCDNTRDVSKLGHRGFKLWVYSGTAAFTELMKYKSVSPTAWGKLYRASLFNDFNLEFPVGRTHEDTAILYKLIFHARRFVSVNSRLYFYRYNSESIMNSAYTEKYYESVKLYVDELDAFIETNAINIKQQIVYRHKSLRYISVLFRLATKRPDATDAYAYFEYKNREYALKSRDILCIIASYLARNPKLLRLFSGWHSVARGLLGKS